MKTYTGGCHCQKVRYEVDMDELTEVVACNCSICSKRGWLLTFVPETSFRLLQGADNQTLYHFNKGSVSHTFCQTCGTASYSSSNSDEGNTMVAINVRCLDEVDTDTLTINTFDGKSL